MTLPRPRYIGQARPLVLPSVKPWRRIVIDARVGADAIVWAGDARANRGTFTGTEWSTIAVPWAKRYRQRLKRTAVNPYPWLVLDTDTGWPDQALCVALNAVGRDLKRKLYIREGLRSRARMLQLWQDAVRRYGSEAAASKWVARPYTSRHGTGKAADVGVGSFGGANLFSYPGARTACARHRVVQPMSWEPWHAEMAA